MDKEDCIEMIKHYDNLFWVVNSIFAVAIGGLYVLMSKKTIFDIITFSDYFLPFFGLVLTGIALWFALGFRRQRRKFSNKLYEKEDVEKLFQNRDFPQWGPYVFIYFCLGALFIIKFMELSHNINNEITLLFLILFVCIWFLFCLMLYLFSDYYKPIK